MFIPFYFDLFRKYIILFGTLFNNIRITRTDSAGNVTMLERVPLTYGPKDKMLARVVQDPNIDRPTATYPLPMISFEMSSFNYDGTRKLKTITRFAHNNPNDSNQRNYDFVPVPYNIGFELNILCKLNDDALQIVEQILPFFQPSFNLTIDLIDSIGEKRDIPMILQNISFQDDYEGDFSTRRALIYTLRFTAKTYLFGPVSGSSVSSDIIKKVSIQCEQNT